MSQGLLRLLFHSADPDFVQQFANISQLQSLCLTFKHPPMAVSSIPQMPNLRALQIDCYESYNYSLLQIIALIWACPRLQRFSFMYYGGNPQVPSVLTNGERSKHQNLNVLEFRMYGAERVSDEIVELVIYVSDNCVELEKVIIGPQGWYPGARITAEMRAAASDLQQKLQRKIANRIQMQLYGCVRLTEAAMDDECLKSGSDIVPSECALRVGGDGEVDRISPLPNEILYLILSYLPVRKAASTTVLSSRWLDLWKQIPNLKFNLKSDRISQLPDHILLVILSSLTLKEMLATSVLSSRWSDLWKLTPSLLFDPYDFLYPYDNDDLPQNLSCDAKYIEMVNTVIRSHKAPSMKEYKINFCVREPAKCAVTKWLIFVCVRKVQSLVLSFHCDDCDEVSNMIVLEESLREMSRICGAPPTLIFFQSLESLTLDSLKVSGEDIKLFLRNCPLLEYLIITSAYLTSDVEVCGASDLMLKGLEICWCKGEKSIKVSAPNLTSITLYGNSAKELVENVPRLAAAHFRTAYPDFVQQFAHMSHLQLVFLTLHCPMAAFWTNGFPQMPNLRKLFIECYDRQNYSLSQIIAIIWASPRLVELSIETVGGPQIPSKLLNDERSKHQNLKVLKFRMSSDQSASDHMVELVIYILNNCVALREVIIGRQGLYHGDPTTDEMRATANLQQKLQDKAVVASCIQLQFFGCSIVM